MKTPIGSVQRMYTLKSMAMIVVIAASLVSPFYQSTHVSAAPVMTPKNLEFTNESGSGCGLYTNIASMTQKWDAAPGASSYNYKATLPNGAAYGPINVGDVTGIAGSFETEGVLSFSVQSVYDGNITSDWADSCAATYDITKPVISSNIASGAALSKTVIITETVSETNPLAYAIRILDVSGNPVTVNGKNLGAYVNPVTSDTISYEWDTTKVADGPYKIQLSARDKADNTETSVIDVTVDNTMPGLTIDAYPSPISDNTPTIAGTVDDNNTSVRVTINGVAYVTTPNDGRWSITTDPLVDGTYAVSAVAIDAAGNVTTPPASGSITTDTTAPGTVITSPASGLVTRGTVQINGTISEPTTYRLTINGILASSGIGTDISYAWNTSELPSGTYLITLTGTDAAGNTASDSVSVTIDNTAPNVPTRTVPANGTSATSTSLPFLSWLGVADTSSPVTYNVQIAPDVSFENLTTDTSTTGTSLPIGAHSDGTYFWRIQACDNLGNCSNWSDGWQFTIDNTAPIVTIDESDTTDTRPTITGTVNDPSAVVTIRVSGITYAAIVSPVPNTNGTYNWSVNITRALSVGPHSVTLFARDILGNSSLGSGAITIRGNAAISQLSTSTSVLGNNSQTGVVNAANTSNEKEQDSPKKSDPKDSTFLGLGWWWAPLVMLIVGGMYYGYQHRTTK